MPSCLFLGPQGLKLGVRGLECVVFSARMKSEKNQKTRRSLETVDDEWRKLNMVTCARRLWGTVVREKAWAWGAGVSNSWIYHVYLGSSSEWVCFLSIWVSIFPKSLKQWKTTKTISTFFFFFKILLCPLIHHYDTLVLEIITKCQLNVYPMDKCWNIYLQIDAFYKEALRFIWKNELLRSWVCHLQRYLVWYQVIHLNLSACLFLYRIVKVRIESIRNGFRTFLEHFSRHLNWN